MKKTTTSRALITIEHSGRRGALLSAPFGIARAVLETIFTNTIPPWDLVKGGWWFPSWHVDTIARALTDNLGPQAVRIRHADTEQFASLPSRPVTNGATPAQRFESAQWWFWPQRIAELEDAGFTSEQIREGMTSAAPRVFLRGLWFDSTNQTWTAEHGCPSGHDHATSFVLAITPDGDGGWLIDPLPDYFTPDCTNSALVEAHISNTELHRLGLAPIYPSAPSQASNLEGVPSE
jgi:hypothetical protein